MNKSELFLKISSDKGTIRCPEGDTSTDEYYRNFIKELHAERDLLDSLYNDIKKRIQSLQEENPADVMQGDKRQQEK